MPFSQDVLPSPPQNPCVISVYFLPIFSLFVLLFLSLGSQGAYAQQVQGMNSTGPTLPIGAGGTVEITVNAPVAPAVTGTVNFSGPIVEGGTTINTNGSTTIGSNGTSPALTASATALTVVGSVNISNDSRTCASGATTDAPAGTLRFNTIKSTIEICDGITNWHALGLGASCSVQTIQALMGGAYSGGNLLDRAVFSGTSQTSCGTSDYVIQCLNGAPSVSYDTPTACGSNGTEGGAEAQ